MDIRHLLYTVIKYSNKKKLTQKTQSLHKQNKITTLIQ